MNSGRQKESKEFRGEINILQKEKQSRTKKIC